MASCWIPAARSQVIPDATLPTHSRVQREGNLETISGGTRRGNALFHSFEQFSIPTGSQVLFDHAIDIQNLLARVTGDSISDIDGLIRTNGTANLFLLNPNGIVFGANARLDVGGSFVATSADRILFDNGTEFSAIAEQAPPLLTVSVPVGLQFGDNPGTITHRSPVGFTVPSNRAISLIGGDVSVAGGNLTAPQGQIELGSVASPGVVRLSSDLFNYDQIDRFGNIEITDRATLDTSGIGSGSIQIRGGDVAVTNGSQILALTLGNLPGRGITIDAQQFRLQNALISTATVGSGSGGTLAVRADDAITLSGAGFVNLQQSVIQPAIAGQFDLSQIETGLLTGTEGTGAAGNLTLATARLQLSDGALVSTTTGDAGNGGNAIARVSDSVEITGSLFLTGSLRETTGKAGNLTIDTQSLSLRQGGLLQTLTFGEGAGGDLTVNATDSVELRDAPLGSVVPTGIFANTVFGSGTGGNIEVNTRRLTLSGGGQLGNQTGALLSTGLVPFGGVGGNIVLNVSEAIEIGGSSPDGRVGSGVGATSFSPSPAGDITINTANLTIRDGASVAASAANRGAGGVLAANVRDTVLLTGTRVGLREGREIAIPSSLVTSSGRTDLPGLATGAAGDLRLRAGEIFVRAGAAILVDSLGSGNAGTLEAIADTIRLQEGARLSASTVSGSGGNIQIDANTLILQDLSQLETDAGSANGGNIRIDSETVVGLDNSDITANALEGRGGRVEISAQAIFGSQFRDRTTPESDITATSQLGAQFDGTVSLETPDIDPASGLVDLPEITTDSGNIVVRGCAAESGNRFVIVGRGGLPDDPSHAFSGRSPWRDWRPADNNENGAIAPQSELPPLVEAQHWVVDANGRVQLVARTSDRISADLDPTCDRESMKN